MQKIEFPETPEEWDEDRKVLKQLKREHELRANEALWMTNFIRPEVLEFAFNMELIMRRHDSTKGDSYKRCEPVFLAQKIAEEFNEWVKTIPYDSSESIIVSKDMQAELLDLANCCMMLWSRKENKIKEE